MEELCVSAEHLVLSAARGKGLSVEISHDDIFRHCENAPEAVAHLRRALDEEGVVHDHGNLPMRASEDFGRFGQRHPPPCSSWAPARTIRACTTRLRFPRRPDRHRLRVFMRTMRNLLGIEFPRAPLYFALPPVSSPAAAAREGDPLRSAFWILPLRGAAFSPGIVTGLSDTVMARPCAGHPKDS